MQGNESRVSPAAGLMDLLLRSGEALRNWRALATLMATGVATMVIFLAFASSGKPLLVFLGAFLAWAIISVGISATGILLMDQALGMAPRSIVAALMDGLFAALRLLALLLIGFAVALLAVLAVAILLVICKIPGLGGFLYAIVLPVSVLAMAFIYGALYFASALTGPAVWSGASIRQALSALYLIIKSRLVESALGVIMLSLLIAFIGGLVGAFIGGGTMIVGGLSVGILGNSFNLGSLAMMFGGMGGYGGMGGSGLVYGGMFGFGILLALVGAVLFCMMMLGLNRLYLHLTSNLDLAGAEAELAKRMEATKERARAMQEEARRRAEEMRQRAHQPVEPVLATPTAPAGALRHAPACPACGHGITPDDKFCENCGQKIG